MSTLHQTQITVRGMRVLLENTESPEKSTSYNVEEAERAMLERLHPMLIVKPFTTDDKLIEEMAKASWNGSMPTEYATIAESTKVNVRIQMRAALVAVRKNK